jgi:hypothetical protein
VNALACSECFRDQGLRLDAQRLGVTDSTACPNCGAIIGRKLNSDRLAALASRFFVWGSLLRCEYGAAPQIQFNPRQKTSITVPSWLEAHVGLIERAVIAENVGRDDASYQEGLRSGVYSRWLTRRGYVVEADAGPAIKLDETGALAAGPISRELSVVGAIVKGG